jgi:uncharacterized protein
MFMADLVVRRLLIDLESPIARHWCGGDAFRTAFFNALSMSFPVGEQFFIDSVRRGLATLPPERQEVLRTEVQGFIGQEATHRRLHALFNAHLQQQGLANEWELRARERLLQLEDADPRHALGATAANEHFTAILAEWLLGNPQWFNDTEPRLKTLWLWHCAEESEHRCTAFDLYQMLGGNHAWRVTWMRRVTLIFLGDALRQTLLNLKRDGSLWRWSTWSGAARFLFGRQGLVRANWGPWRRYFREDFHPRQQHSQLSEDWLSDNVDQYKRVGSPA